MSRLVVSLGVMVILLAGCASDPRNAAEADAIRLDAASQAASDRVELAIAEQRAALELVELSEVSPWRVAARRVIVSAGAVAACVALGGLGVGLAWASVGAGRGAARLAAIRSGVIPLAEPTRQFPLVVSYVGKGRLSLTNPNSGSVIFLDTRRVADRGGLAGAAVIQLAGAVAREARRSSDAAGVSVIPGGVISLAEGIEHGQ